MGKDHSRVVLVLAFEGTVVLAMTRVQTAPGQYRGFSFFEQSLFGLEQHWIDDPSFWDAWDMVLERFHPAVLPARMAVVGGPVVVEPSWIIR